MRSGVAKQEMRFGVCCRIDQIPLAVALGFEFVELSAWSLLDADLSSLRKASIESTHQFFPPGIRLWGSDAFDWRSYAHRVVPRASEVGVRTMVMGSGTHRASTPEVGPKEAEVQFYDMASEIQSYASPYGIAIAPESLSRNETDVANDPGILAEELARRGVGYTLDTYHALNEWEKQGEPIPITQATVNHRLTLLPTHVHLADRKRSVPAHGDAEAKAILRRLADMGYGGRIALECADGPFEEKNRAILVRLLGTRAKRE